jgi:hypothetical protein
MCAVRHLPSVVLVALLLTLSGCGEDLPPVEHDDGAVVSEAPAPPARTRAPVDPTVLEKDFVVEEGVWYLSDGRFPRITDGHGLLHPGGSRGLWVTVPGLYGRWPVRLEVLPAEPRVARWCEDVVEAPYANRAEGISMGSFETWSRTLPLAPGSYRVRLCARGLDAAATEPEFDGSRYHVYSSRHLIQVWPAPPAPVEVVRTGSRFASHLG